MRAVQNNRLYYGASLLVALVVAVSLLAARPAHAKTFTVNSTQDFSDIDPGDGICDTISSVFLNPCTLRGAIQEANNFAGPDIINFDIPGSGVKTIKPSSKLPDITRRVTIDGYTQPGTSENTLTHEVINANLLIELDGTNAGDNTAGLLIAGNASNTVIRGLVINSFGTSGILTTGSAAGIKIEGNFLGTSPAGTADEGNDENGVFIGSDFNTVGGTSPAARNLISGNDVNGVAVAIGSLESKVAGNLIGPSKNGGNSLGNSARGVVISGDGTTVGGAASSGAANVIAFNGADGVLVPSTGTGNRIFSNSIHSNGELGIDLVGGDETTFGFGVTKNDTKDPDTGANSLQNFPAFFGATTNPDGTTTISGKLNSSPEKTYTIQFFRSLGVDPSGWGEGKTFLGPKKVETNKNGNASFTFTTTLPAGEKITATATGGGGTSEFSSWGFD